MERRKKSVGNGEGSKFFCNTTKRWKYQYYINGGAKVITQRKKESKKQFDARVTKIKNELNTGTYIGESTETVITLLRHHIENKHIDGTTSARSYKRDLDTLKLVEKTCQNFCYLPIQRVTISHIEEAKKEIRKYANSVIDKIWNMLKKSFKIACSASRRILIYNIMEDEELKKPMSIKKTEKKKALTREELARLNSILDNEERSHPYRNAVKLQAITGMRIGEVLARSISDYDKVTKKFNIHNTLTEDENCRVILGEHTKTYNKKQQFDGGQRYLPLNKEIFAGAIEIIKEQSNKKVINMNNMLFWDDKKNTYITPREVNAWLRRINKKYKITKENLSTHRLRHTALTNWNELGIELDVIQYLAGHERGSDITKKVYIDITEEYIDNILEKIS